MTPERWRQIGDLFDAAVRIDPPGREAWLRAACGGDDELRAEVGRLLAQDERADRGGLLAPPGETLADIPRVHLRDTEPFTGPGPVVRPSSAEMPDPSDRLARLQLLGEIARGGMGAILKGRDTDLGRDLAVKVLLEQHREQPRAGPPVRRGGADRRPVAAPRRSCRSTSWAPSPTAGRTSP